MEQIIAVMEAHENGTQLPKIAAATEKLTPATGSIAVITVFGVLSRRANMFTDFSGGTSIEQLSAKFDLAMNDPSISTIVLLFDSPGGSVEGLSEFSAKVYAARKQKQIVGMIDTFAASAAYYIACACSDLIITPSGMAGSIGTLWVHEDESVMNETAGLKYTFVQAGQYKTEMTSLAPLSEDAKNYAQYQVDYYYKEFVDAVAKFRNTTVNNVTKNYGQGRMLTSKDALEVGMVDRIETFENVIRELTAKAMSRQKRVSGYAERKGRLSQLGVKK
jgi:capsid assembly protease